MEQSACKGVDPEIFFDVAHKTMHATREKALGYCNVCPVIQDCLNHAIQNNIHVGIWGGMSNKQRRIYKTENNIKLKLGRK
jgi:WhiB family redox-sensing transcriptional regulator